MNRPLLEVADIFRSFGAQFAARGRTLLSWPQHKVMRAIERCRTAALGTHRDRCTKGGHDFDVSYNSCRNRHCPKCQTQARNQWVAARTRDLVPLTYFHVVFTTGCGRGRIPRPARHSVCPQVCSTLRKPISAPLCLPRKTSLSTS
jgi:hypothetical protein